MKRCAALLLVLLTGCSKEPAKAVQMERDLTGRWNYYSALPVEGATIDFKDQTYIQRIAKRAGAANSSLSTSGDYTLSGNDLTLTQKMLNGAPPPEGSKSQKYALEWISSDLVYATETTGSTQQTIAFAKNGAKPDPNRIRLTLGKPSGDKMTGDSQNGTTPMTAPTTSSVPVFNAPSNGVTSTSSIGKNGGTASTGSTAGPDPENSTSTGGDQGSSSSGSAGSTG